VSLSGWVQELKRRRVFRALIGWGVASFAILQVAEPLMHALDLPDSILKLVVALLCAGFPVTVALAWIFDAGAGGITRTPDLDEGTGPATSIRGVRLGLLLAGLGLAAAAPGFIYFFVWHGTGGKLDGPAGSPAASAPSVAVLPFADMSPNHDQEYFADGIAEEIRNALVQVEGLKVIGRTSSFSFKGKTDDLQAIGRKLGVANVLEGSLRKDGDDIRITAQLVRVADGSQLWSQSYDRKHSGILKVQDEIGRAVVGTLKVKLLPGTKGPQAVRQGTSTAAHEEFLLGRDYLRRGVKEGNFRLAASAFEGALALDPGYAPAWAGLSRARLALGDYTETQADMADARRQAMAAAEKAITLDPGLPDGYIARATARRMLAWDFAGAEADVERALALNPGDASATREHAVSLYTLGRRHEAVASYRKAADLDPLDSLTWVDLGMAYLAVGNLAGAREATARAHEISPDDSWTWLTIGLTALLDGNPEGALAATRQAPDEMWRALGEALALHSLGKASEARAALDALKARFGRHAAYQVAQAHAWRGERDAAFAWFDRAYRQSDGGLITLKSDPLLRSLRDDPRYAVLLRKLNLPVD
jgi:TolB-like protein/Tfp pilus assembly protein PilF